MTGEESDSENRGRRVFTDAADRYASPGEDKHHSIR